MRIFSTTRRKLTSLAIAAGVVLVPAIGLHAHAGFGPNRATFTMANPASYVTFNSITDNNQAIGDERTFYTAYAVGTSNRVDPIGVSDNEEIALQVYFHNDASSALNLTATNTRLKLVLPTNSSNSLESTAYISADNAVPQIVSDTVNFNGSAPFTLSYEPGTAKLWTNFVSGGALSDDIVNGGALIGTMGADGSVPGCTEYSGYVTIKVRVHITPPVVTFACSGMDVAEVDRTKFNFTVHSTVQNATVASYTFTAKDGNGNVVDTNTVTTGAASADYHFDQSKAGTYTVSAVVNTDHGSTPAGDCVKQIVVQDVPSPIFACTGLVAVKVDQNHYDLTASASAQNATVVSYTFTTKDSNGKTVDTKTVTTGAMSAVYHFNQSDPDTYTVSAVVNTDHGSTPAGDCVKQITIPKETPNPVFACNSLNVTTGANRAITATVNYQADNGAKLQSINYDFGDGNTKMTDQTSVTYTYPKDDKYTVAATLTFNVGNTTKTARCAQSVTIKTPTKPPVVLSATTLPNTGPGEDIAGLFAGASALGAAGHYMVARRNRS